MSWKRTPKEIRTAYSGSGSDTASGADRNFLAPSLPFRWRGASLNRIRATRKAQTSGRRGSGVSISCWAPNSAGKYASNVSPMLSVSVLGCTPPRFPGFLWAVFMAGCNVWNNRSRARICCPAKNPQPVPGFPLRFDLCSEYGAVFVLPGPRAKSYTCRHRANDLRPPCKVPSLPTWRNPF